MRRIFKSIVVWLLTLEARLIIRKYKPGIIAVTGSVGKTSIKDAIYAGLADHCSIRKSQKTFNTEVGIPLAILGCPNGWRSPARWLQNFFDGLALIVFPMRYPKWLVLEVGADRPGDIRKVASWLPVDIAVITRLPDVPVHVEYFDSPEMVAEEKAALISALKPSGTLVLYGDNERTRSLAARAPRARILTFGLSESVNVRGKNIEVFTDPASSLPSGMRMQIQTSGAVASARIEGVVGEHAALPLLAAVAVGVSFDRPLGALIASYQAHFAPPPGRMRLLRGINGTLIIDDTYNSSPAATLAALETLHSIPSRGRKIAALADMLELGRFSVEEHKKAGIAAARCADILVTVGFRARDMAEAALDAGMPDSAIFQFEDSARAGEELARMIKDGDCILVKGSQSTRMERTVEWLMAEPEKAGELLVRQEPEWKKR